MPYNLQCYKFYKTRMARNFFLIIYDRRKNTSAAKKKKKKKKKICKKVIEPISTRNILGK